jgi:hypothetical protein
MENKQEQPPKLVSAVELLTTLFTQILADSEKFDSEVVALTKIHLGVSSPQAKAGNNLANALIELAKNRVAGGQK